MHPLAAPGTLWVLSRVGKYLVRPQAGETSHKKQISCGRQGKALPYFFPFYGGFRLCGGDQRAFRSPFGNLRALCSKGVAQKNRFLVDGKEKPFLTSSRFTEGFASAEATRGLSGRPLDSFGGGQKLCHDAVLAGCETIGFTFTWACEKRARFSAAYGCGRSFRSDHALFIAFSKLPDGTAPAWGKSPTSPPASAG